MTRSRMNDFSFFFFLFCFSGQLMYAEAQAQLPDLVSTIPGDITVSNSGAAEYNIPIELPPGTAGVQPELSLNYSSEGDNGLLGVGWSLSGLSVIHRCPATYVKDGFIDGIDFDSKDRFCMDGQPLIAVSGIYGANLTEYRTEIDSFSKIVSYGSTGNGPQYFKVWTKSGDVMEYGNTADSLINPPLANGTAQNNAVCWLLNKVSDRQDNYLTITYFEDAASGENYPTSIKYTGKAPNLAPYNEVKFIYENRPDIGTRYLAGVKMASTKRLVSIVIDTTLANNQAVNDLAKYNITYQTSIETGRSLIENIDKCDQNAKCVGKTSVDSRRSLYFPDFKWSSVTSSYALPIPLTKYINASVGIQDAGARFVDLNGDGLQDIVRHSVFSGTTASIDAYINTGTGWQVASQYNPPVPIVAKSGSPTQGLFDMGVRFVDLNGDGLQDMVRGHFNGKDAYLNSGSGWVAAPQYAPPENIVEFVAIHGMQDGGVRFVDLNGDGLQDLIKSSYLDQNTQINKAYINTGSGWQSAPQYVSPVWMVFRYANAPYSNFGLQDNGVRFVDLNADGLEDIVQHLYSGAGNATSKAYINSGNGWLLSPEFAPPVQLAHLTSATVGVQDGGVRFVDLNGDGLQDLLRYIYWGAAANSNGYTSGTLSKDAYLNTGAGWVQATQFEPFIPFAYFTNATVGLQDFGARLVDLNGDGSQDLFRSIYFAPTLTSANAYLNSGNGWQSASQFNPPLHTTQYVSATLGFQDAGARLVDLDGDGLQDVVRNYDDGSTTTANSFVSDAVIPDVAIRIQNGFFVGMDIVYKPLTDSTVYTKGTSAVFPAVDIQTPMYVVSETRSADGAGGQNIRSYSYEGAQMHTQGRGFLGFNKRLVSDATSGVTIDTTYRQDFPFIGLVVGSDTKAGGVLVAKEFNIYGALGNPTVGPAFPYAILAATGYHDLNSGVAINGVVTQSTYDSYGNPTQVKTTATDIGVETYVTTANNTYVNDVTNWLIGRLTQATVVKTKGSSTSSTRTSSFTYNSFTGQLLTEKIEPGTTMELVKTYTYDGHGNRTSVITSGSNITSRTSSTSYDSRGRFPVTVTNALGHAETREYNDPWGNVTKLTGPNLLNTVWEYDTLGRKTKETRADGTITNINYAFCDVSNPCPTLESGIGPRYSITTSSTQSPTQVAYYDVVNRVVLSETQSFDASKVYVETEFDGQSRVKRTSLPYTGASPSYWTTTAYDALGRPTQEVSPATGTTTYTYTGLLVTVANDLSQIAKEMKSGQGKTLWTEDNDLNRVTFTYDAAGNLTQVSDGTNTTTNTYDIRGFRTGMTDPDMGQWSYVYNVLGELTSQTNAKNQTTTMTYDLLGRLKTRVEPEGTTTWNYDTATKGKGKLASVVHYGGYTRTHNYDSLGRPSSTSVTIGSNVHTTSNTYDSVGRVDEITYPTGFKVKQKYTSLSFLEKVVDVVTPTLEYWKAQAMDEFGNITLSTVGGVLTARDYENQSGRLFSINSGATTIQNLQYTFDNLGNLTQRKDLKQSKTEDFLYDSLNRLTTATLVGVGAKTYAYDSLGNMTNKSDVGAYTYAENNAGPHAVTKTVQGVTTTNYTYDANGNMLTGNGRTITWASYNKPTQIQQGANTVNFIYGPGRARYQQTATDGTTTKVTTYVGSLYEKELVGTTVTNKHYIRAGNQTIAIHTTRSSGPADTRYLHRDHLGSVDVITDENQAIVEQLSFDAFGKRRQSSWSDAVGAITSTVTRGFTGHEQLDSVGLVHMNGRVYDPALGRFLSADPFVQQPKNLQSLNRYSYVINNPLSYTDPSGFFFKAFKKIFKKVGRAIRNVVKKVSNVVNKVLNKIASNPYLSVAASIAVGFGVGYAVLNFSTLHAVTAKVVAGAAGGFAGGFVGSGGDIRAGIIGGFTGAAAGFIAGLKLPTPQAALAHGFVGGATAEAQGGKFGQGFASSFLTKSVSGNLTRLSNYNPIAGGTAAAVVGGTISKLTGGKFANGATTAAFAYAFTEGVSAYQEERAYQQALDNFEIDVSQGNAALFAGDSSYLGTQLGADAAQYWANIAVSSNHPLAPLAHVPGAFASLWTPDTYLQTSLTLSGGYAARVLGPFTTRGLPRYIQRARKYIRYDRPHHGKGYEFDGVIPNKLRGRTGKK